MWCIILACGHCIHIQWFQWLKLTVNHWYVTLVWCYIVWSSQKCTNVMHNFSVRSLYQRHFTYFYLILIHKNALVNSKSHLILVQNTENLVFYEMFCMQYTRFRVKIIFMKSQLGCRSIKCNSFYENSLKHVY